MASERLHLTNWMPYRNVRSPDRKWHSRLSEILESRTLEREHRRVKVSHDNCIIVCKQTLGLQDFSAPTLHRKK